MQNWNELDEMAVKISRALAMDAVQKVGNGHPGTAVALAPVAYRLLADVVSDDDGPGYSDPTILPPPPEQPPYVYNEDPQGNPEVPTLPGPDEDPFYQMPFWDLVDDFFNQVFGTGG